MGWSYDARLRWKLLSGFGAVVALMIAVGLVGLVNMQQQDERLDEMYEKHTLSLSAIMQANVDLVASGRDEKNAILADDHADIEKFAVSSRKLLAGTIDHIARFEQLAAL